MIKARSCRAVSLSSATPVNQSSLQIRGKQGAKINATRLQSLAFQLAVCGKCRKVSPIFGNQCALIINRFRTDRERRVKRTTSLIRVNSRN